MMTAPEENEVLAALQSRPPEWLLYLHLSDDEFLRVFPNAGSSSARFVTLESWLDRNYAPFEKQPVSIGGYRLYHRIALP
jgi:hypothetical protein